MGGMRAVDVAVAVVRNAHGQVLLAERTPRQTAPGFWELPGGKIEHDETPAAAAARELAEETGLAAQALRPLMSYDHVFPTKRVRLHLFDVAAWQGTPSGREGQRLAWADPASPGVAPILPSNTRVLTALGLPARMEIIGRAGPADAVLAEARAALAARERLLQLRGTTLAPDQFVTIARRICLLAQDRGAKVLLAGSPQQASRAGAAGVHSLARGLRTMAARPPVLLWSVEVEDADDLARAQALGADLAVMPAAAAGRLSTALTLPVYIVDGSGPAVRLAAQATQAAATTRPPVPARTVW
jgi:8-oxo-dGTP diphosphatase